MVSHITLVQRPPPMVVHVLNAIADDVGIKTVEMLRTMSMDGKGGTPLVNCPMLAMLNATNEKRGFKL